MKFQGDLEELLLLRIMRQEGMTVRTRSGFKMISLMNSLEHWDKATRMVATVQPVKNWPWGRLYILRVLRIQPFFLTEIHQPCKSCICLFIFASSYLQQLLLTWPFLPEPLALYHWIESAFGCTYQCHYIQVHRSHEMILSGETWMLTLCHDLPYKIVSSFSVSHQVGPCVCRKVKRSLSLGEGWDGVLGGVTQGSGPDAPRAFPKTFPVFSDSSIIFKSGTLVCNSAGSEALAKAVPGQSLTSPAKHDFSTPKLVHHPALQLCNVAPKSSHSDWCHD